MHGLFFHTVADMFFLEDLSEILLSAEDTRHSFSPFNNIIVSRILSHCEERNHLHTHTGETAESTNKAVGKL